MQQIAANSGMIHTFVIKTENSLHTLGQPHLKADDVEGASGAVAWAWTPFKSLGPVTRRSPWSELRVGRLRSRRKSDRTSAGHALAAPMTLSADMLTAFRTKASIHASASNNALTVFIHKHWACGPPVPHPTSAHGQHMEFSCSMGDVIFLESASRAHLPGTKRGIAELDV